MPTTCKELLRSAERGTDLSGLDLCDMNIRDVELSGGNLSGADLDSADLSGANLSGADLSDAILTAANMNRANLSGADLSFADLSFANMGRANLSGARLSGVMLQGVRLYETKGLGPLLIYGGKRSDGYDFYLINEGNGVWSVRAGCRYMTLVRAYEHWNRSGIPARETLNAEARYMLWQMEAEARDRGWL